MKFEKAKIGYLAGIIDGEGCITITKSSSPYTQINRGDGTRVSNYSRYLLSVRVANTDIRLIKWLVSNFGGTYNIYKHKNHPTWKDKYTWWICGKKSQEHFLLALLPYLIIKKDQAKLALEFIRIEGIDPVNRQRLYEAISLLTKRGKLVETNTFECSEVDETIEHMIESDLMGDYESVSTVT